MSRPFWFTATTAVGFDAAAIYWWADSNLDATVFTTITIWTLFALAIIDIIRTSGGGPTTRWS